jgi:hypothetical protein
LTSFGGHTPSPFRENFLTVTDFGGRATAC